MRAFGQALFSDRRGASAVEFALIAPMLLVLAAGLIDGSRYAIQALQVRSAAQAGADYALAKGWSESAVETAADTATNLPGVKATAKAATECVLKGQVTTQSCPTSGAAAGQFVTVTVQSPFTALMPWPGLPAWPTVSAQATVRIL